MTTTQPSIQQPDLLAQFFAEFLDEEAFAEFRRIERLFASLTEQGSTRSGYPVIRPVDCSQINLSLRQIFKQSKARFRTCDPALTERFETLIATFSAFCRNIYPGEATNALLLHCQVLLLMGRADQVLELISPVALRPYAVPDNLRQCRHAMELYGRAHLMRGTLAQAPVCFVAFGAWLVSSPRPLSVFAVGPRMAPYVCGNAPADGRRARFIHSVSDRYLKAARVHGGVNSFVTRWVRLAALWLCLALGYRLLKTQSPKRAPFSLKMNRDGTVLVARAMGGIGDILMMEPGLEALARQIKRPVDFAIPAKFFPIFQNNPHVNLIDIDGPLIDIGSYSRFVNLSLCPAGRYESGARPFVRRGRVEIFAREMGITPRLLTRQGWHINQFIDPALDAAAGRFLAERGLGKRRVIGIQPYSRDSYKDHPHIASIIAALARDHDILIFHHLTDGLPSGPGIANTAGVSLSLSLALVARIDAMVCVDSAFLHAAAAHDIPVIAMFGPTDARTFTRHHKRVEVLWKAQEFGCVPCWRNEDLPCRLTGLLGVSPCMAAIAPTEVTAAVARALGSPE